MMPDRETVLIVDDERFNINVLVDLLSPLYETMVAKSGEQALQRVQSGPLPDIILLDIVMPGMDGFDVCKELKCDPRTADIPVIFISALDRDHDEERGLELGAADYVSKPFSPHLVRLRVKNILKLKRQSDLLRELANVDGLTGIANRRRFDQCLENEWARSLSYRVPLSVILMDIDFFKAYNDNYGHLGGDQCLADVARALNSIVGRSNDLIARYGGEEFVCLLPNVEPEGCRQVAERLRVAVESLAIPHAHSKAADHVTVSLGAATLVPHPDISPKTLIKMADEKLYSAKEQGRNRLVS